jgi:hypothetical protein
LFCYKEGFLLNIEFALNVMWVSISPQGGVRGTRQLCAPLPHGEAYFTVCLDSYDCDVDKTCPARFPHPNLPPQAGEGAIESLRESYDHESTEVRINELMGQIRVGWGNVL